MKWDWEMGQSGEREEIMQCQIGEMILLGPGKADMGTYYRAGEGGGCAAAAGRTGREKGERWHGAKAVRSIRVTNIRAPQETAEKPLNPKSKPGGRRRSITQRLPSTPGQ